MPELPDVTVFAENLKKRVAGKKITAVSYYGSGRCNVSAGDLAGALTGRKVDVVERWGKELCFRLDDGRSLLIHLMLNGGFTIHSPSKQPAFPVLTIAFADGFVLTVHDPKGLVTLTLDPAGKGLAPDALEVTPQKLQHMLAARPKMVMKAFLIDQKIMRGIGNAYADEILWEARIAPRSLAGKLSPEAMDALAGAIPSVLQRATEQIRTGNPGIISGEIRDFLSVHNPSRKESPTGHRIMNEVIVSKKTYFTDEQRLYV